MTLREYLHDRRFFLGCHFGFLVFAGLLLASLRVGPYPLLFLLMLDVTVLMVTLGLDFMRKRSFFNQAATMLEQLEQKYYLSELLDEPEFIEGQKLVELFRAVSKSMNDTIAGYRHHSEDYGRYIETWVHEVKTPIASCKLIIENHQIPEMRSIDEEIDRIDQYVEQALYYTRSTAVEKDYVIRRCPLSQLVSNAIKAQARPLIANQFSIQRENLDHIVYADPKWIEFVLSQLLNNAVKYRCSEKPELRFSAVQEAEYVSLMIRDNGVGILARDLPRIFDKGFTGDNGRQVARSTGIGLYLVKQLCDKMHIGLKAESEAGSWTAITLNFPLSSLILPE